MSEWLVLWVLECPKVERMFADGVRLGSVDPARQLPPLIEVPMALAELAPDLGADYGEVFTRRWIVELILDLVGYTRRRTSVLAAGRAVLRHRGLPRTRRRPADRVGPSARRDLSAIGDGIRAFDLLDVNASGLARRLALRLEEAGVDRSRGRELTATWVTTGDFLLADHEPASADLRRRKPAVHPARERPAGGHGRVPAPLHHDARPKRHLRRVHRTGPRLLTPEGTLGFICADRWMRNQYGADLRELVSGSYAVDTVLTMHDVDAFEDDVSAYPAVVVLETGRSGERWSLTPPPSSVQKMPRDSLAG